MQEGPLQRYRQTVEARELAPDTAQELAAEKLQLLANRLAQYSEPRLGRLLSFARRRSAPEGLYLYGGVGRGKTMKGLVSILALALALLHRPSLCGRDRS